MRQWRVGNFSMAVLLIALGTILLAGMFKGIVFSEKMIKLWPVILIILGVEILGYLYFSKEEHPKIKYDVFSIFMTIVIVMFSLGFYTISSIGIIPRAANAIASQDYKMVLPQENIIVDNEIEKVVINCPSYGVEIISTKEKQVMITGLGEISATSKEEANKILEQGKTISNKVGNILYIDFVELPRAHDLKQGARDFRYRIFLPGDKKTEIKHSGHYYTPMEVNISDLSSQWMLDSGGEVKINIEEKKNMTIEATTTSNEGLKGNVVWEKNENPEQNQIHGTAIIGDGRYRFQVFNHGDVELNVLK